MLDINIVQKQWAALGQDFYEIGIRNEKTDDMMSDIRSWSKMVEKLKRYDDFIVRGENLYIRAVPNAAAHDLIFLDDISILGLAFLNSRGFIAACIIETSPGNYQGWFRLGFPASIPIRKICERLMIDALDAKGILGSKPGSSGADRGANDGQHYGRLASSRHQGSGFIVRLESASGHILAPTAAQSLVSEAKTHAGEEPPASEEIIELRELLDAPYERPGIERDLEYFSQFINTSDQSKADYFLASRLAKKGYSVRDIAKALALAGPNDYGRKDKSAKNPNRPAKYLLDTARKAVHKERGE